MQAECRVFPRAGGGRLAVTRTCDRVAKHSETCPRARAGSGCYSGCFLQVEVIKKAYMQGEVEFEDGENGEDGAASPRNVGHNIYILAHQVQPWPTLPHTHTAHSASGAQRAGSSGLPSPGSAFPPCQALCWRGTHAACALRRV